MKKPKLSTAKKRADDPHDPNLTMNTRFGFIWKGVHFERCCVADDGAIHVYIGSKREQRYIRVTKGGRISMYRQ